MIYRGLRHCYYTLTRKKDYGASGRRHSKFNKLLNSFDVTVLSLGASIGVGPYIFIGDYHSMMGPGMLLAFVLAGLASFLSALCYSELTCYGAGSGGAYSVLYRTVGEFPAVFTGWLIVFENVTGAALAARFLPYLIWKYTGTTPNEWLFKAPLYLPEHIRHLVGERISLMACFTVLLTFLTVSFIYKNVMRINDIFVVINANVLVTVINVLGAMGSLEYWHMPKTKGCGDGGFFPYGLNSILENTAQVYLVFMGFDTAVHASAETLDADRIIPFAMMVSIGIVTVLNLMNALAFSLTMNYCEKTSGIFEAMEDWGVRLLRYVCLVGIPLATTSSMLSVTFPLSRMLYSLADDGLFFGLFSKIHIQSKTPMYAVLFSGLLTAIFAMFLTPEMLRELTCLMSMVLFNIVAANTIYLRYVDNQLEEGRSKSTWRKLFNFYPKAKYPNTSTAKIVGICCFILLFLPHFSILLLRRINSKFVYYILPPIFIMHLFIFVIISSQPQSDHALGFKLKPHPLLPFLTIIINAYLSLTFSVWTWARFVILMSVALITYFAYGLSHSKLSLSGDDYLY